MILRMIRLNSKKILKLVTIDMNERLEFFVYFCFTGWHVDGRFFLINLKIKSNDLIIIFKKILKIFDMRWIHLQAVDQSNSDNLSWSLRSINQSPPHGQFRNTQRLYSSLGMTPLPWSWGARFAKHPSEIFRTCGRLLKTTDLPARTFQQ